MHRSDGLAVRDRSLRSELLEFAQMERRSMLMNFCINMILCMEEKRAKNASLIRSNSCFNL